MSREHIIRLLALALCTGSLHTASAAPVMIVGEALSAESISAKDLKRICTGSVTTLDGVRVELILPLQDSAAMSDLLDGVINMKSGNFERLWSRRVLSGNGVAPKQLSSAEAVLYVSNHPTALAVVDDTELESTDLTLKHPLPAE